MPRALTAEEVTVIPPCGRCGGPRVARFSFVKAKNRTVRALSCPACRRHAVNFGVSFNRAENAHAAAVLEIYSHLDRNPPEWRRRELRAQLDRLLAKYDAAQKQKLAGWKERWSAERAILRDRAYTSAPEASQPTS